MALVALALLVSSAPATQWVALLTRSIQTSHQVQLVHQGCDVFVVLKHPAVDVSSQLVFQQINSSHRHTAGDNLIGFFGRTLETQQDHVIQLPCEGSAIGEINASEDAFRLDPEQVRWSHSHLIELVMVHAELAPKPLSCPGNFSCASRMEGGLLSCIDTVASRASTVLLI